MILRKSLTFIFLVLFSLSIAHSVCMDSIDDVSFKIYSGNTLVGSYIGNEISSDRIHIKSNLNTNPLKVRMDFSDNSLGCILSGDDITFSLFPGGLDYNPSSYSESFAEFLFDMNINLTGSFSSNFKILSNGNYVSGNLVFEIDRLPPVLDISYSPESKFISPGTLVGVTVKVQDQESGLDTLFITTLGLLNFNGSNLMTQENINAELSSSKTYKIVAKDILGNEVTEEINFIVDNEAPVLIKANNEFQKVYSRHSGRNYVSFKKIRVEDISFELEDKPYEFIGNFESINPSASNEEPICERDINNENAFLCDFNDIEIINVDSTSNVKIYFDLSDRFGNENKVEFQTEEIFVDTKGPEVLEFYLENSLGVKNHVSYSDYNSIVYLRFKDESLEKTSMNPIITENFEMIVEPSSLVRDGGCSRLNGGVVECIWDLGDSVSAYSTFEYGFVTYKVDLLDGYGNSNSHEINVSIDNVKPLIVDHEIIVRESIETRVIKSGDKIDIKLFILDENLDYSGDFFVVTKLNQVSHENVRNANCYLYNSTTYQCDFKNIQVKNGYLKKDIIVNISDVSGNLINYPIEIEILKKGDELLEVYHVEDLNEGNYNSFNNLLILNPINRNAIMQNVQYGWFEGKLSLDEEYSDEYQIINYDIKCEDANLNPILVLNYQLFPYSPMFYEELGDEEFAIKVELSDHENSGDLNDKTMNCEISVLKRDEFTVYGLDYDKAERIPVKLHFSFYDMPRGDLLQARAEELLSDIEEISFNEDWFDGLYDMYSMLNSICTMINTGGGLMNSVNEIITLLQSTTSFVDGFTNCEGTQSCRIKSMSESGKLSFMEPLTTGYVKLACDFVTCRNGFGLFDLAGGLADGSNYGTDQQTHVIGSDNPMGGVIDTLKGFSNTVGDFICSATPVGQEYVYGSDGSNNEDQR